MVLNRLRHPRAGGALHRQRQGAQEMRVRRQALIREDQDDQRDRGRARRARLTLILIPLAEFPPDDSVNIPLFGKTGVANNEQRPHPDPSVGI